MKYEIPWPPSMNRLWRAVGGRVILSKEGREYYARAREVLTPQVKFRHEAQVRVHVDFYPPDRRRRDLDNLLKAVLDAGTKCGVWRDDSQVIEIHARRMAPTEGGLVVMEVS